MTVKVDVEHHWEWDHPVACVTGAADRFDAAFALAEHGWYAVGRLQQHGTEYYADVSREMEDEA